MSIGNPNKKPGKPSKKPGNPNKNPEIQLKRIEIFVWISGFFWFLPDF
jgi:hypothetical protein